MADVPEKSRREKLACGRRPIVTSLLKGRVRITPTARQWALSGKGGLDGLFERVLHAVVRPHGDPVAFIRCTDRPRRRSETELLLEPPADGSGVNSSSKSPYFNSSQITVAALRAKSACVMPGTPVGASAAK